VIERSLRRDRDPDSRPAAVTIGVFDGVHRGHQRLLGATVEAARADAGLAVAVTFTPHPRAVLNPQDAPPELTTLGEKRELLAALGIERIVVLPFTREVSLWTAEEFCERLLAGFAVRHLIAGPSFALGHDRRGDIAFLRAFGAEHGFDVLEVGPVVEDGNRISSTRVRSAVVSGRVDEAARLLGRPYFVDGPVEHGEKVGRRLGFPTANVGIEPGKCLPALGIYASWLRVRGCWHQAASSIGYRPTFRGERLTVEAHILDFDDDIYDEPVRLAFTDRLREERMYPDEASLIVQMHADVSQTRRRLEGSAPPEV
jgi:riboflavin kinase/FMN adenylyltransferase